MVSVWARAPIAVSCTTPRLHFDCADRARRAALYRVTLLLICSASWDCVLDQRCERSLVGQRNLLLSTSVRGIPGGSVSKRAARQAVREIKYELEQLLDEVDVCHDHAPAAVPLAPELVHCVAVSPSATRRAPSSLAMTNPSETFSFSMIFRYRSQRSPVTCVSVSLERTASRRAANLPAGEASNRDDHRGLVGGAVLVEQI